MIKAAESSDFGAIMFANYENDKSILVSFASEENTLAITIYKRSQQLIYLLVAI